MRKAAFFVAAAAAGVLISLNACSTGSGPGPTTRTARDPIASTTPPAYNAEEKQPETGGVTGPRMNNDNGR